MSMSVPNISRKQAISLALNLFSLRITDTCDVKELDSYEDVNFLLKGRLVSRKADNPATEEKPYVLKVLNPTASRRIEILTLTSKVLLFLKGRGIECPVPQPSIFGDSIVWCRIPRKQCLDKSKSSNEEQRSFKAQDIGDGVETAEKTGCNDWFGFTGGCDDSDMRPDFDDGCQAFEQREIVDDIELVRVGYNEKGPDVDDDTDLCAVLLFSFVPGHLLCDAKWTTDLLFDFGLKIGNLHRLLKEFSQSSDFPDIPDDANNSSWDLQRAPAFIMERSHAVEDSNRRTLVQEIARRFQSEVLPKLKHDLETQVIHCDLNEHNIIVDRSADEQAKIKGFIDFGELAISYRVLDFGVALGYLVMESFHHGMGANDVVSHVIKAYQSEFPLSRLERETLLEAAKVLISQSLVMGAYNYKYVCPGNEYVLYSAKTGWKALDQLEQASSQEILNTWLLD